MDKIILIVFLFIIISFGLLIIVNKNWDNGGMLRIIIFLMKKLQHQKIRHSKVLLYLIQAELGGAIDVLSLKLNKLEIEYIKWCYDILTDVIYGDSGSSINKERESCLKEKLEYIDFDKIREVLLIKLRYI